MTKFYTVLGFTPEPFAKMTASYWDGNSKVHSFNSIGAARNYRTRMINLTTSRGKEADYRILGTNILEDGTVITEWIDA